MPSLNFVVSYSHALQVIDHGIELRIRVFTPAFRSRHEVIIGDEELQAMGLPPRPCPVLLKPITVQWVPTWDREEVARLCLRYLHAQEGECVFLSPFASSKCNHLTMTHMIYRPAGGRL